MTRRKEQFTNRDKLRKSREALKALDPEKREALYWNGIGPGDSYIGLWRAVNHYRAKIAGYQSELRTGNLKPSKRQELERAERYYAEQVVAIYGRLLGHEKPALTP
jgi:hypothetical protein